MPNTSVPAAGEALLAAEEIPIGRFSRRALLGAIASVPAMAAATAAVASISPAAAAEHPDAELFLLEQEMEKAFAEMNLAGKSASEIGEKCEELYPPRPPKWERPSTPDHILDMIANMTWRDQLDEEKQPGCVRAWHKEVDEQKAANEALHDAYRARVEEIKREGGIDAAEDAFDARVGEMSIGRRSNFRNPGPHA
jgi:hypothetical protein